MSLLKQSLILATLLTAMSGVGHAATVTTEVRPGNVLSAVTVHGVVVNGVDYNVTFGFNGFQATTPADLTFLGDAAGALDAASQLSAAVQAANVEELVATDFTTDKTYESNNFVIANALCTGLACVGSYIGDEGNRTTNGSPWLYLTSTNIGIVDEDVFAIFSPVKVSGIPEPSTWAIMVVGFCSLGLLSRRRRRTALAA